MATKNDALSSWKRLDEGQRNAIVTKLWIAGGKNGGDEVFEAILRGEIRIDLTDISVKLVDVKGRCIPPAKFGFEVTDANTAFCHTIPTIDLRTVYDNFRAVIPVEFAIVTYEQFVDDYQAIMAEVADNRQVANIAKGLCLPVIMPKHDIGANYGQTLEDMYLKLVADAYKKAFPTRTFENWRKGELAGQVTVVDGTRHDRLISMVRERSVVGVFCMPMQGFGIKADRAMIKLLPDNWLLAGGVDTAMAFAGYPGTLARDFNTPVADCAALQWLDPEFSLCLFPDDDGLVFGYRDLGARDNFSAAVFVLRQRKP